MTHDSNESDGSSRAELEGRHAADGCNAYVGVFGWAWSPEKGANRRVTRVQPAPRFRDGVQRQPCALCGNTRGFKHAHHATAAEHLRTHVASLRLPDDEARRRLRALLSDPRNAMALHPRCHLNVEAHFATIPRERIPAAAFEFAAELGPWATMRLERMYPAS